MTSIFVNNHKKIIILPHRVIIMSCVYLGWDGKKKNVAHKPKITSPL